MSQPVPIKAGQYRYSAEDEVRTELNVDAGNIAREMMKARSKVQKFKRFMLKMFFLALFVVVAIVSAIAYYGYYTRVQGYQVYNRSCTWKVGETEINGTRKYSSPFAEYFGYRVVDSKSVEEKTFLTLTGSAIQIIGLDGDNMWVLPMKDGERGNQPMAHADRYIFQQGKNISTVKYGEFCK